MQISIVIPTRNRPQCLRQCVEALLVSLQGSDMSYDIHVVDDGSGERLRATNKAMCDRPSVTYHLLAANRGMAVARNLGARHAAADWIAFIDDDIVVDSDWAGQLSQILSRADRRIAGIEGYVRGTGDGVWDREVESLRGGLYLTCHIVYRSSLFHAAGGLDEHFEHEGPYHEDHELAARVLQYGEIPFASGLKATHLPRTVPLLRYVLDSAKRISQLLNAEIYFYLKQRDRYHLFRNAQSFWGTYRAVALRHVYSTIHRRSLSVLIRHPLQAVALAVATAFEQVVAWCLAPHLLRRYLTENAPLLTPAVDIAATSAHWGLRPESALRILRLEHSALRVALFRLRRTPVYDISRTIKAVGRAADCAPVLRFYLRVDDVFFADTSDMEIFLSVMHRLHVPYLAAVTGNDMALPRANRTLETLAASGASVGLHGFAHSGSFGPFASEILQMSLEQIDEKLRPVMAEGCARGFRPIAFVPPFNAINALQIRHLAQAFPIICGGPETARFTERFPGPIVLKGGSVYFPSFFPFYADSSTIRRRLRQQSGTLCGDICLTVHMNRECVDKCASLGRLVESIRENLHPWPSLPFRTKGAR